MSTVNPYGTNSPPFSGNSLESPRMLGEQPRRLKKIDPLSAAIVMAGFNGLIGLVAGLMFTVLALLGNVAGGQGEAAIGGLIVGVAGAVFMPLFYGVAGFIGGALFAFLYNLVAGMFGGVIVYLET